MTEAGGGAAAAALAGVGHPLDDVAGRPVGTIDSALGDAIDGTPTWLLVRTRRFGRRACVPAVAVAAVAGRAFAPYSRETIRASSEVDSAAGLTCGDERALAGHFGFPEDEPRLLAIAGREDDDDGSVPL